MTDTQFGLFQGPENVKTADAKIEESEALRRELAEAIKPAVYLQLDLRMKILRGFIGLHFNSDPDEILKRPLEVLGGRTLESMCFTEPDYKLAYAWTQEYRLHPDEKDKLIAPFVPPFQEKKQYDPKIQSTRSKKLPVK
jgi:hypothetical protein